MSFGKYYFNYFILETPEPYWRTQGKPQRALGKLTTENTEKTRRTQRDF
jgi:hypothetical protein